ncbi:MAG TPA: hypothetical protein P5528_16080 [Steroidobacteraceae bacterium]|nr:hypothetical protein [Steroidobacteraceae bacterium]HRX90959.1 hypothetical protein [Steroidobacteraceae bacterium]
MDAVRRHLARVFSLSPLLLAATFAGLFALARAAGMFGWWLGILLLFWFIKYLYVLIDDVAHGGDDAPVLSMEMIAPLSDFRAVGQIAILVALGYGSQSLSGVLGSAGVQALQLALLALLPASVAIMAIERNLLRALNPVAITRVIAGLGGWYLTLLAAMLLLAALTTRAVDSIGLAMLQTFVELLLWLLFASLLGGALYERRLTLGIDARHTPEHRLAREHRERDHERARFLDEVFAMARNGAHDNAWRAIELRLDARAHSDAEYDWLLEALQRLTDSRHLHRLRNRYLTRLVQRRRSSVALNLLERIWRSDADYQPDDAAAVLTLARLAVDAGAPADARRLLSGFDRRFPAHPARELAARLLEQVSRQVD